MAAARRSVLAALVGGCLVLASAAPAGAQLPEDTTTSTTTTPSTTTTTMSPEPTTTLPPETSPPATFLPPPRPPTITTTSPAPDELAPALPRSTPPQVGPGPPPPPAPAPGPAPAAAPPPVLEGGDSAEPPPGTAPVIPPELQAQINSVRRTGSSSTVGLLEALAPLRAMGLTEQEAIQAGFGRFPVGGRATYSHDWWFPRYGPGPGVVRLHQGTDIFAPYGTPVRASAAGVLKQTFNSLGGLSAYVFEPNGTYYYLAHLSRFEAGQVTGQSVKLGDVIGYVGDSGNARGTPPHVHFEIHPHGGGPVDPKLRLDAWLKEALAAVPKVVAQTAPRRANASGPAVAAEEQELTVVGHTDLGGDGAWGDIALIGSTALVAGGSAAPGSAPAAGEADAPCQASVTIVDLSDPSSPDPVATIRLPKGERVEDLDAVAVDTPSFTGELAVLAMAPCAGDGATGLAYYDVSEPTRPRLLSRLAHPRELADSGGPAPGCAEQLRSTCPRSSRSVEIRQVSDGRVLSLTSAGRPAEESHAGVFVVDATEPEAPMSAGWAHVPGRVGREGSNDGCSPVLLTQKKPADPPPPRDVTGFRWQSEAPKPTLAPGEAQPYRTEVEVGGRRLALATEDHWWSSNWALRVDPNGPAAGDRIGCPGLLTGVAATGPDGVAGPTAGAVVYVGRGCPERRAADGSPLPADPYLADPAGKIAVADAALSPRQAGLDDQGCSQSHRLDRARQSGAFGLVVAGSFLPGEPAPPSDMEARGAAAADGPPIPALQVRKPDGDALREALCPPPEGDEPCPAGTAATGSLVELPGQWAGLRVLDVTNPDAPRQVEMYRTANAAAASPSGSGSSYAVQAVVADGTRVYAAWGADGLRVVDLASGAPVEVASFVPPQPADLTGDGVAAHVAGVASTTDHVVVSDRASGLWVLDKRPPAGTRGYWLADADGGVHAFGDAHFAGSAAGTGLESPVVGIAPTPSGRGYRLVAADGGTFAFGDASFEGSLAGTRPSAPIVGIASSPTGRGYWLAGSDGGVYAFGDAPFLGSLADSPPSRPVVAVVATPTGKGYWLVGEDGGVFAFGDAEFLGSTAAAPLPSPIVGATATSSGRGYWLAAADGGVFAFGDARFKGSVAGGRLPGPVVGITPVTGYRGYWLAGSRGGVYALGGPFLGARDGGPGAAPVVAVAAVPHPRRYGTGAVSVAESSSPLASGMRLAR